VKGTTLCDSLSAPDNWTLEGLEFQKLLHLLQCLIQRLLKRDAAGPRTGEAQLVLQLAIWS
jgi:hypothetical protein